MKKISEVSRKVRQGKGHIELKYLRPHLTTMSGGQTLINQGSSFTVKDAF